MITGKKTKMIEKHPDLTVHVGHIPTVIKCLCSENLAVWSQGIVQCLCGKKYDVIPDLIKIMSKKNNE